MYIMQGWRSITSLDFRKDQFEDTHDAYLHTSNISYSIEEIVVAQTGDSNTWILHMFRRNILKTQVRYNVIFLFKLPRGNCYSYKNN